MTPPPFGCSVFHLALSGVDCRAHFQVNGFPVLDANFATSVSMAPIVNPFLLDGRNDLSIRIASIQFHSPALSSAAKVSAAIVEYPRSGHAPFFQEAVSLLKVDLKPEQVRSLYETQEVLNFSFRAKCASVAKTYLNARPIESAIQVDSLRQKLDSAMTERDESTVMELFAPKIKDYAAALGGSEETVRESFRGVLADGYFRLGLAPDQGVAQMQTFAEGRLWEIARPRGPYLLTRKDAEGGVYSMRIFVAQTERGLRIVR